jgi:CP family cyanate transporter-like MFS transporter
MASMVVMACFLSPAPPASRPGGVVPDYWCYEAATHIVRASPAHPRIAPGNGRIDGVNDRRMIIGIAAAGFNLQTAIVGVGPVIDDIREDTGMSSAAAGLLQTMPFLCVGLFSLTGLVLVRRLGPERLVACALTLIAAGAAVRAAMPLPALLVLFSIPLGLGIAFMAVSLPTAVKSHFPDRIGAVTGALVASLSVGNTAAALTAVPLGHALGSWRWALAAVAVPAAATLPVWLWATRERCGWVALRQSLRGLWPALRALPRPPRPGLRLGALFASQSIVFAAMISWVAALYREQGWSDGHASVTTAVIAVVTIPAALLAGLSDGRDRRPWVFCTAVILAAGTFAIALAPTTAPWVWITLFGIGTGAIFPFCLALPLDVTADEHQAATLTAWMLGVGYCFSSLSPAAVGGLRDLTGGFTTPMALLGGSAVLTAYLALSPSFRPRPAPAHAGGAGVAPHTVGGPAPDPRPGSGRCGG